jgi:hypothetical protein
MKPETKAHSLRILNDARYLIPVHAASGCGENLFSRMGLISR